VIAGFNAIHSASCIADGSCVKFARALTGKATTAANALRMSESTGTHVENARRDEIVRARDEAPRFAREASAATQAKTEFLAT